MTAGREGGGETEREGGGGERERETCSGNGAPNKDSFLSSITHYAHCCESSRALKQKVRDVPFPTSALLRDVIIVCCAYLLVLAPESAHAGIWLLVSASHGHVELIRGPRKKRERIFVDVL